MSSNNSALDKLRLDRFLCETIGVTRREATILLRRGEVSVDGDITKKASMQITQANAVMWKERALEMPKPRYFMLHKPSGFVCTHEDGSHPTALDLLDEVNGDKLHFAGRLDVDTTGLVLITDDGQWSHKITSPKRQCSKTYRVWLEEAIQENYSDALKSGIQLNNEKNLTLPAEMTVVDASQNELLLSIQEGKYHQVKRMFAALGNKVEQLHRESIGKIELDPQLEVGEYRPLTEKEIASIG